MELQNYMKQVSVLSDIISSITYKLGPHYRQKEMHIYTCIASLLNVSISKGM
jgi:hypothetical protein